MSENDLTGAFPEGRDPEATLREMPGLSHLRAVETPSVECYHCGAESPDPGCVSGMVYVEPQDAYTRCPKAAERDRLLRVERRYEAAGIDLYYRGCTLESFRAAGREAARVMSAVATWTRDFETHRQQGRGLLLHGPVGVGKTHLAYAAINALVREGEDALAVRAARLSAAIKDTFSSNPVREEEARRRLERITSAPVLLLDDLGKSVASEWQLETLHELLSERRAAMHVTLVTTNYSPDGELAARVGESAESRLVEMCRVLRLGGEDYRRREKEEG